MIPKEHIASADDLTEENIVIGIKPFLNDWENIIAVNGKSSLCFCHNLYTPLSKNIMILIKCSMPNRTFTKSIVEPKLIKVK